MGLAGTPSGPLRGAVGLLMLSEKPDVGSGGTGLGWAVSRCARGLGGLWSCFLVPLGEGMRRPSAVFVLRPLGSHLPLGMSGRPAPSISRAHSGAAQERARRSEAAPSHLDQSPHTFKTEILYVLLCILKSTI